LGHPFEKWPLSPPQPRFSLGAELDGETRRTSSSRSFREEILLMVETLSLSGSIDSGKLCTSRTKDLLGIPRLVTAFSILFSPL